MHIGSTGRCSKFSLYHLIRKMSVMHPTAAKKLRYVNFKEYYFGFFSSMIIVSFTACKKEGPAERAGKKIDETVEKAGEKIEESAEKAKCGSGTPLRF